MTPKTLGMGKVYNIKCEKPIIPEFPDLLFGEHEDGSNYFDATIYLPKSPSNDKSVKDFFTQFNFQTKALAEYYNIPDERLVVINADGHQLIAGCFCFLFLSYMDKSFNAYLFERIDDLFSTGWTVSDSFLAEALKQRFTPDICQQIFSGDHEAL